MKENIFSYVAEVSLKYSSKIKNSERPKIEISEDACDIFYNGWDHDTICYQETFKVMFLNRGNKVLGVMTVSIGGVAGTVVDPKIIFTAALKASATGVILCHNHPSGNLEPSRTDISITKKLVKGGELLEVAILDHLIITEEQGQYFSFADNNML